MKSFFIKTFGCQMNIFDSNNIFNILKNNGFINVNNINFSDIIIINTCSVRESCNKKFNLFLKKKINKKFFIITGCASVLFVNFLLKNKNIKIIIGPQNGLFLLKLIRMYYFNKCKQISINFYENNFYENKNKINNNFYLTIIEGCNKYCSYCIVPYSRGKEISKNLNSIFDFLKEIKFFYKINLLGQTVTSYLSFIKIKKIKYINFICLLNYLSNFFYIKYINYISPYVKDFNSKFINIYKFNKKLINHLHLPAQSFSNRILFKMNRNYSVNDCFFIFNSIRKINIKIFFSTDIIVGFLDEKNIDFNKNLIFVEKFIFDKSYIFIYNPRPYTKIYFLKNKFSRNKIDFRFLKLKNKIKNNIIYLNKVLINKIETIFIKSFSLEFNDIYLGILNNNRLIRINFNKNYKFNIINKFINIKILNKIFNYFLGKII